jgi:hypothetical protein
MLSIMAGLGPLEFRFPIGLRAQEGSHFITGREQFAGGSTVLPTLSDGLEIELSDSKAKNAMLTADHLRQAVENVIGGILTVV